MKMKKQQRKVLKKKRSLKVQLEERRRAPTAVGVPGVSDKSSTKLFE